MRTYYIDIDVITCDGQMRCTKLVEYSEAALGHSLLTLIVCSADVSCGLWAASPEMPCIAVITSHQILLCISEFSILKFGQYLTNEAGMTCISICS